MCKRNIIFFVIAIFFCSAKSESIPTLLRDPFLPATAQNQLADHRESPLLSVWIPVYFATADSIKSFLYDPTLSLLSPRGKMHYDAKTNQIWVQDDAAHLHEIQSIVSHLNQSGPQFLIKARILTLDKNYQKELGVLFSTQNQTNNPTQSLNMNMPQNTDQFGQFTLTISKLSENNLLNMQISALEQEGHAKLISSPTLMTLNNQAAAIESGAEVPYEEATSSGATSVSFKKAVLRLQVTPTSMFDHRVLLHIALNQDKVSALIVKGVPAIQTQQITTQVILKNNTTIVLGGILEQSDSVQKIGTPGLNKLPILGGLFNQKTHQIIQQELLIFITPTEVK
ncbi:MAG: hypothetical protein A3E82_02855 [Gammaproteobacteria bacterium RIFCSPHIGHO2_12_FULL_38_11]|nr:MAG: hypothetical protein A3E82_02855 [Gammaproteobacteria bacterium RIFCSPHIGHO2_12_FULL_38_11]